jgi:N-acetylmuramoyl-L-alanine amidase
MKPETVRFRFATLLLLAAPFVFAACAQTEPVRSTQSINKPTRAPISPYTPPQETYAPFEPDPVPTPQQGPVTPALRDLRGLRIIVDAGHGGKDPGTQGISQTPEKVLALDLANRLASELRTRGASVTTTRDKDVFIELEARAATAEKMRADLFVSVHCDAHKTTSISGATVYIARNASAQSRKVGMAIEKSLKQNGIAVRGLRTAGFVVLVKHSRPAVLIESGYLTNPTDSKNLNDPAFRARLVKVYADGIQAGLRG